MAKAFFAAGAAAAFSAGLLAVAFQDLGYDNTPMLPGQPWRVHDIKRPHPPKVDAPAACDRPVPPPSDAVVLFNGKDFSQWVTPGRGADRGKFIEPKWKIRDGYMEVVGKSGDIVSKEKFGTAQYHVEWMTLPNPELKGQWASNSGVIIMSRYEIQVLESHDNVTYADGQAGAIYGQWPPLVNPARKPGEWQTYDIFFEAPQFEGDKVARPAYMTVVYNGVLVQHHQEIIGAVVHARVARYRPHAAEEPLLLQDHDVPVRFRNVWVRRLKGYDQNQN